MNFPHGYSVAELKRNTLIMKYGRSGEGKMHEPSLRIWCVCHGISRIQWHIFSRIDRKHWTCQSASGSGSDDEWSRRPSVCWFLACRLPAGEQTQQSHPPTTKF